MDFSYYLQLFFCHLIRAFFILLFKEKNNKSAKYISVFTTLINLILSIFLWYSFDNQIVEFQFVEEKV